MSQAEPSTPAPKLLDSLSRAFGPFLAVFGSAAAVSAFLIFSGFLSDFGAYRLAGLPRLNMTLTSLAEQGADTLVDGLALLAGGLRGAVLVGGLLLVLLVWGWHDEARLRAWVRSISLYRLARVVWLVLAVLVAASLIERTQRSLSGSHFGALAVESALAQAYAGREFPDPHAREMAIERQTYALSWLFPLANLGVWLDTRWDAAWQRADTGVLADSEVTGIPLRALPEARRAARHMFGWLTLFTLLLCSGLLLLGWWGRWLGQEDPADKKLNDPGALPPLVGEAASVLPHRWSLHAGLLAIAGVFGEHANEPIERLLAPLTLVLAVICLALLPLAHGLLARESLGAETVMVFLNQGPSDQKQIQEVKRKYSTAGEAQDNPEGEQVTRQERSAPDLPQSAKLKPAARLDCPTGLAETIEDELDAYREALRDLLQKRPAHSEYDTVMGAFGARVESLGSVVAKANCADAVALMWAARPPVGLRASLPQVAEMFQRTFRQVQAVYGVRVGTLLGYPRDGQGLTLAETIVPLPQARGGQSSVVEIPRPAVAESMVIPNIERRRLLEVQRRLLIDPDSDEKKRLLFAASGESLAIMTDLLEQQKLHTNAAGVAVTMLGTMASVANMELPRAATRAVDRLAELASAKPAGFWPEKSDDIRGTAVTAMHLAHSPYAAHRFIEALRAERVPAGGCVKLGELQPLACLPTVATAAGYVFQDILNELQNFRTGKPPSKLLQDRDDLATELVNIVVRTDVRDDVRGAACSALGLGGKFDAPEEAMRRYWQNVRETPPDRVPFSAPACLSHTTVLGVPRGELRPWLRLVARGRESVAKDADRQFELRRTALIALADIGVTQEDELMFELYEDRTDPNAQKLSKFVTRVFSGVSPDPLARRLLDCAVDAKRSAVARVHCLRGMVHLDNNFDGDEGAAAELHDFLASGRLADAESDACKALTALRMRGSKWLRRLPEQDPVMEKCKKL